MWWCVWKLRVKYVNVSVKGRLNFVFFLFFGARKRIVFIFQPKKTSALSFSFLFSVLKWPFKKKQKRKSVLWLSHCTAGRTLSHLQSHTAAVYIATAEHEYCEAVSTEQWADCLLSLLLQSACVNSPSRLKILVGATNKCCQRTTIQCRWTDLFWSSK